MAAKPLAVAGGAHFGGIAYPRHANALVLHASIGADFIACHVDRGDFSLREVQRLTLASPIQYVWPHPSRNLLYVACSNRSVSKADDLHALATVEVDDHSGAMRVLSEVPLPTRPIHLTIDAEARSVLVVYNSPSRVTAHVIDEDGRAGPVLSQASEPWAGHFPHQVLMLPSGEAAVIVARGNHATPGRAEDPGSFEFLSVRQGRLDHLVSVAPNGGAGFGPRHLDFHPGGRWAAVSVERQNELYVFAVERDRFATEPVCRVSTLERPSTAGHDQLCSSVHFHPNGRVVYVANRHDTAVYGDGSVPSDLADNSIAVFSFDAASGRAELLQTVPTDSIHVRTFSLDASAGVLAAASILPALARREDGSVARVPARLSFFRVAEDGRLTLARVQDMHNERVSLFWTRLNGSHLPI
jgi:6-phosphogluconolactonase (cycloisomerase 2 family)